MYCAGLMYHDTCHTVRALDRHNPTNEYN